MDAGTPLSPSGSSTEPTVPSGGGGGGGVGEGCI